jgi:hypothetical protein
MISPDFWQERYETEKTPWDLGGPSPHFVDLLKEQPDWLKPGRMAVPGAGRGHDAALFAGAGFDVVGFDYSPAAVERSNALYGKLARFVQADIFTLPDSPWAGQFDFILEHTCFCAILPKQRPDYARMTQALLKPGGLLIGIFWEHVEWGGPPFSTTQADLTQVFGEDFELLSLTEQTPANDREGVERLVILRRLA